MPVVAVSQQQFNKRSSSYVDITLCCPLFANGWKSHEQTLGKPVLLQELAEIRSRTMHLKLVHGVTATKEDKGNGVLFPIAFQCLSFDEAKEAAIHHYKSFKGSWPESESFSDTGLGAVPIKFKGECVAGDKFYIR
ncbi:hypothetical protein Peur_015107 [Populus x canadensis]